MFTLFGFLASFGSFALVVILLFRRFFLGAEAEGVFTLFAMLFFLISVAIVGIGLIGEYIGRIYKVVQSRPKYVIKEIVGFNDNAK
jgi:undecaprenyl-phosphate 4-deoxy-4-formamido-L-arabinose transferase